MVTAATYPRSYEAAWQKMGGPDGWHPGRLLRHFALILKTCPDKSQDGSLMILKGEPGLAGRPDNRTMLVSAWTAHVRQGDIAIG